MSRLLVGLITLIWASSAWSFCSLRDIYGHWDLIAGDDGVEVVRCRLVFTSTGALSTGQSSCTAYDVEQDLSETFGLSGGSLSVTRDDCQVSGVLNGDTIVQGTLGRDGDQMLGILLVDDGSTGTFNALKVR